MPTIYRFPILYRLAMRVGYGTDYGPRHALVAPAGAASTCAPSMCARVARCPWPARPLCRQACIGSTTSPTPCFHACREAARRLLVVAEPVRNVSRSRVRAARWIARILTRTDDRVHTFRYTAATLLDLDRR